MVNYMQMIKRETTFNFLVTNVTIGFDTIKNPGKYNKTIHLPHSKNIVSHQKDQHPKPQRTPKKKHPSRIGPNKPFQTPRLIELPRHRPSVTTAGGIAPGDHVAVASQRCKGSGRGLDFGHVPQICLVRDRTHWHQRKQKPKMAIISQRKLGSNTSVLRTNRIVRLDLDEGRCET
jgi:hypothetical protein